MTSKFDLALVFRPLRRLLVRNRFARIRIALISLAGAVMAPVLAAADQGAVRAPSPTILVDWTPGSDWRTKLSREGQRLSAADLIVEKPAKNRDVMQVRARELQMQQLRKKSVAPIVRPKSAKSTDRGFEALGEMLYASTGATAVMGPGEQSTELIKDMAWGLGYDPLRIFNWVLTNVEYAPYYGVRFGAHLTALELRGNDYDQCILLVSLLKQSGISDNKIEYIEVDIDYNEDFIFKWTGWDFENALVNFQHVGVPIAHESDKIRVRRVMVRLTTTTGVYLLDPAFKRMTQEPAVGLPAVYPAYSSSSLNTHLGAVPANDDQFSVTAANVDRFQGALSSLAAEYVRAAARDRHGRSASSLLGLPVLTEPEVTELPLESTKTGLFKSTPIFWTAVPAHRFARVRYTLGNASVMYRWCDISDDIMNLRFGTDGRASLYRDHDLEKTETGAATGNFTLKVGFIYPEVHEAADPESPPLDGPYDSTPMTRSGYTVVLPVFLSSQGRLKALETVHATLAKADPSAGYTHINTLALAGLQRAVIQENSRRISCALTGWDRLDIGAVWFFHLRGRDITVDSPINRSVFYKFRQNEVPKFRAWETWTAFQSATEHICVEGLSTGAAVSTVSVLESSLRAGNKIFRLTPSSWSSLSPQIDGGVFPGVQNHVVTNGNIAFVPSKRSVNIYRSIGLASGGALFMYNWSGFDGWASGAWTIDGGFQGGFTNVDPTDAAKAAKELEFGKKDTGTSDGVALSTTIDPVDLNTGAFLYELPGLKVGNDADPNGLHYKHYYSSAQKLQDTALIGGGWTHSYDLFLTTRHGLDLDIRTATVAEVAPLVVMHQYLLDTNVATPTAAQAAARVLVSSWAARQYLGSKSTVALGSRRIEFQRLTDGSFIQSSNIPATLAKQADGSHVLSMRHGNSIKFRALDGRATEVRDQHNNLLNITYYEKDQIYQGSPVVPREVTDAYQRKLIFAYNTGGLVSVTESRQGTSDRLIGYARIDGLQVTNPDGGVTSFEVEFGGRIIKVKDPLGRPIVINLYDSFDRVWAQQQMGEDDRTTGIGYAPGSGFEGDASDNRTWTFFDRRGRKTRFKDAVGNQTHWLYDGADRLVQLVGPYVYSNPAIPETRTYTYDANHVMLSETKYVNTDGTNAVSATSSVEPDAQSRPWKITTAEGRQTVITYTAQHQVETITKPGGLVESFTYDARGKIEKHRPSNFASAKNVVYVYDTWGSIDKVTYPDGTYDDFLFNARGDLMELVERMRQAPDAVAGLKTTFAYNKQRMRTKVIRWDGGTPYTSQTAYDLAGDVDYTLDEEGRKVDLTHDALGHLLEVRQGAGQIITLKNTYEPGRMLVAKVADGLGHETQYVYDAAQRSTDTYDPLSRRTKRNYDSGGRPTTVLTPSLYATTTGYSLHGLKEAVKDGEGDLVSFDYDKDGRMVSLRNRNAKPFTWEYDDVNRKRVRRTPLQKTSETTFDERGSLLSVKEPSDQLTQFTEYDDEGRLLKKIDGVGEVIYSYWPSGLLKEVTEGGRTTFRAYDALNRLNEYRDGEGNSIYYNYHSDNRLKEIHYPVYAGVARKVSYTYDDFGRLKTVTDWANRVTTYYYDDAGRMTEIRRPGFVDSNENVHYTYRKQEYDAAGQLRFIRERREDGSYISFQELRYDDDGRITYSFLHPKSTAVLTIPLDVFDDYDDDNRLSKWNSLTVAFDPDGNMTHGPLPSGVFGTYGYDARNRLISAGGCTYRYNPDGLRVEEGGLNTANYVIDPNAALSRLLLRTKGGVPTFYVYGLGLLYEETGAEFRAYHFNHQGSTIAMTSNVGLILDKLAYAPFGSSYGRVGSTDSPFWLHGEFGVMTDANGLAYMRNRYYNPRLMRFLNADPIGFKGGLNWYMFVANNPISYTDPKGLKVEWSPGISSHDKGATLQALSWLTGSPSFASAWSTLVASPNTYVIGSVVSGARGVFVPDLRDPTRADISWLQPDQALKNSFTATKNVLTGEISYPALTLAHEVGHAARWDKLGPKAFNAERAIKLDIKKPPYAPNMTEKLAHEFQNLVARELGQPEEAAYSKTDYAPEMHYPVNTPIPPKTKRK